jgi:hypothetical protein
MSWQREKIKISKKHGALSRVAIAKEVIDYIIKRTKDGKDKNEAAFQGYSASYKKSLDFKIAGKSPSKVNLTLSKEMLNSLELLSHKPGEITIGYDKSNAELNGKVEGNRLGTYGNSKPVTKPRDFLGIRPIKLKNIESQFPTSKSDKDSLIEKLAEFEIADRAAKDISVVGGRIIFDDLDEE